MQPGSSPRDPLGERAVRKIEVASRQIVAMPCICQSHDPGGIDSDFVASCQTFRQALDEDDQPQDTGDGNDDEFAIRTDLFLLHPRAFSTGPEWTSYHSTV